MDTTLSYYVREHQWRDNVDGCGTSSCLHCNSSYGIGFHYIMECNLRFNEKGFKKFLDFRNISTIDGKIYVRRFSDITYTRKELIKQFKSMCDKEIEKKVKEEKYVCENKM